jgi:hypothetical protein
LRSYRSYRTRLFEVFGIGVSVDEGLRRVVNANPDSSRILYFFGKLSTKLISEGSLILPRFSDVNIALSERMAVLQ